MQKHNWDWKKLQKGRGIKVQIPNDIDKETGKQKYRPAIVIKSYPSHVTKEQFENIRSILENSKKKTSIMKLI